MQKWEYQYIDLTTSKGRRVEWDVILQEFNDMGAEGWELVGFPNRLTRAKLNMDGGVSVARSYPIAFLKRPLAS